MEKKDSQVVVVATASKDSESASTSPQTGIIDPTEFSKAKKWSITLLTSCFTLIVSSTAVSYSLGVTSMMRDLQCSTLEATLGLSLFSVGFGIVPLFTSAFGEEFGRLPVYYISILGFALTHMSAALSPSINGVLISRFFHGAFGSSCAVTVAGTITDIWSSKERGLPMSVYSLLAMIGNGLGALMGGWIEYNPKLGWRWIQWVYVIVTGIYLGIFLLFVPETRADAIQRKQEKRGGKPSARIQDTTNHKGFNKAIYQSCTRPIYILFSEPIVFAISVWIGLAWGVYFCLIGSLPRILRTNLGFNSGQIGTLYMTFAVGSAIGFFTNMYQEKLYRRSVATRGPQGRLQLASVSAFVFPLSMLAFAWTSFPYIHWTVQMTILTVLLWSIFTIYLAAFTYLADCYGTYASSALAGQNLFRNMMAAIFPVIGEPMFAALGYRWPNTIFAIMGLVIAPVPLALFFYGQRLIARSQLAKRLTQQERGDTPDLESYPTTQSKER